MIPVYITQEARARLWAYIMAMPDCEIGGFGFATIDQDNRIVWYDTFLVDQEASGGGIDFTDKGVSQAITKAAEDGFFQDPNGIWVWWHSHHSMSVFWSATDEGGVDALRESGVPYMLSFVGNTKGESKMRLDLFDVPIIDTVEVDSIVLRHHPDEPYMQDIRGDILENVYVKPKSGPKAGGTGGTSKPGATKTLPPGTRSTDPGDKLEAALAAKAGYAEYNQDELEGKTGGPVDLEGLGWDVDDEGDVFNWKDCLGYVETSGEDADLEAQVWTDAGGIARKYNGCWFLFEDIEYYEDKLSGEMIEVAGDGVVVS